MNKAAKVISLDEAFQIVDTVLGDARPTGETVAVRSAHGKRLLDDQVSRTELPPFDKAAMDGYAVLANDERNEYLLLETIAAGHTGTAALTPGTAVKVMTGAAAPAGTGRIIMVEHAREQGNLVQVRRHSPASNICRRGEDIRIGDNILPAGSTLGSLEMANLISCGITEVEVARQIRVAVISTGDEIVDSPADLAPGKIMNSNGPMLAELATEFGLVIAGERSVPDSKDAIQEAIRWGMQVSDLVLISGGVSVGEFDFVLDGLADAGLTVHFSRVAVQPGKPTVFATSNGKVVFGLPGNPVSVYLMFHLFALRAAVLLSGGTPRLPEFQFPLAADFKRRKTERRAFVPGRLAENGTVEPVSYHGSAHLLALTQTNGFIDIPVGVGELSKGEEIRFMLIGGGGKW